MQHENNIPPLKIVYLDDDDDDHFIFSKIFTEIDPSIQLVSLTDREKLISYLLKNIHNFPDCIFLDLNMPKKNGYECLLEIKKQEDLKHIPVVIYSTSYYKNILDILYEAGAFYCIQKSDSPARTKKILGDVLESVLAGKPQPARNDFVMGL